MSSLRTRTVAAAKPAPVATRAARQRERILEAAEKCFIESGFHAASMAHIADTAGISAGLIYRYFESKSAIVRAIISLAHGLRLKVIAEGVESEEQLGILRRMGCDQYQGFFRSAAVPAAEIERFVREDAARTQPRDAADIDHTQSKLFRLREA